MRAAQGAAPSAPIDAIDSGLQAVIDHWQSLPDAIRAGILAMVNATEKGEN